MPTLIHVVYASVAAQPFTNLELAELLRQSRAANERIGVTGMLLYSSGNFFQVLEGDPATVDELFKKLSRDKRHRQLTMIVREPIARRSFADWSMGFSNVTPEECARVEGLNDFFLDGSCFAELDSGRAKKLLAAFAAGCWRAKLTGMAA